MQAMFRSVICRMTVSLDENGAVTLNRVKLKDFSTKKAVPRGMGNISMKEYDYEGTKGYYVNAIAFKRNIMGCILDVFLQLFPNIFVC